MFTNSYVKKVYNDFEQRNQGKNEYLQACKEILESLEIVINKNEDIEKNHVLERFLEPDRIIQFKVNWIDDKGNFQTNTGFRVQYNNAIGPYKGGLRFHPSVNASVMEFLALEQCLKNSLTSLPLGGAKGGSDFDPKGKSENEIRNFCQAFMLELAKYIGPDKDIPAGDIGVGTREIGYLFGFYKKLTDNFNGAITGKDVSCGGCLCRKEATGYGLCYFTNSALNTLKNTSLEGKTVIISGAGNVAINACKKAQEYKAKVVAMSDSNGYIYDNNGINLEVIKEIKEVKRGRVKEYLDYVKDAIYVENNGKNPSIYSIKCDIALPCATQNELTLEDAKMLVKNNVIGVFEGANMPTTLDAIHYLIDNGVIFGPGKAANAGGVAVSGIEMMQNAMHTCFSFEEVDAKLYAIMKNIFKNVYETNIKYGIKENDLLTGANITGFEKIYKAIINQGM